MQNLKLFKMLLIASIVINIFIIISGSMPLDTLPESLQKKSEMIIIIELILGISTIVLWIVSIIGLWKLKKWGRNLLITSVILTLILYIIDGVVIMNAWENMFSELFMVIEGILISMSFSNGINKKMS